MKYLSHIDEGPNVHTQSPPNSLQDHTYELLPFKSEARFIKRYLTPERFPSAERKLVESWGKGVC